MGLSNNDTDLCYVLFLEYKTRVYVAIIETLRWFAGKQIRDVAVSETTPKPY